MPQESLLTFRPLHTRSDACSIKSGRSGGDSVSGSKRNVAAGVIVIRDAFTFPGGESYDDVTSKTVTRWLPEKRPFFVNGVFSDPGERWRRDDGNLICKKKGSSVNGAFPASSNERWRRAEATEPGLSGRSLLLDELMVIAGSFVLRLLYRE